MSVVTNRYIQALLELPKSEEENKMLEKELKDLSKVISSNKELEKVLIDPRIESNLKVEIIKEIFPEYTDAKFVNLVKLLVKEGRINLIQEISEQYEKANQEKQKILNIKIIAACKLEEKQIEAIVEKYKTMYKVNTIKYEIKIDESLLGGVKIMVGNKIYDGSVETQLKQMF